MSLARKVVVIAAHPDDEVLGCGGAIVNHLEAGDEVSVIFLTDGVEGDKEQAQRRGDALRALSALQTNGDNACVPYFLDLPDQSLDLLAISTVADALAKAVSKFTDVRGVDIVYTHWIEDLNEDHVVAAKASLVVFRPSTASRASIYSYEVPSSSEWGARTFAPTMYVELSERCRTMKLQALAQYKSELRESTHPRSIRKIGAQMEMRGSAICTKYAEAFQVVRQII